jgi:N-methylhydantoinase B/oxoprolinase/acetone carboxylase alpha subunit
MNLELEIFRNLFVSIAEEMGIVLRRTSFSANIKERRDYSCAIYDAEAETIAMGDHMPVHLGAMPASVAEALRKHTLGPGDVVILNDPFHGGTHLPDITTVSAVFLEDGAAGETPAYYLATRAHHADVGGMMPGSMPLATEIFQEGLRIPPVKLVARGEFHQDVLDLVLANVRTPEERRGDLGAQIAAHHVGERRLREAARKHGRARIAAQMAALKDYTETILRNRLREIPDGVYEFEDFLDEDGFESGPVRIQCRLTIAGDRAIADYSNSALQVRGGINANRAVTTSATMYCFRCLIEEDVPYNAGLMRPVEVVTRPGTVVDARPPASVAAGNVETSQRITDTLLGALHQALPGRIPAASSGTMNNVTFGGIDPRTGEPFAYYETIAGGMGARSSADGIDAVHTHMTNSLNTPVEALEHLYPLRLRRYGVRKHSGGAGRHRGGDGIVREFEFLTDTDIAILSDRRVHGPYGLDGGEAGQPGRNLLNEQPVRAKGSLRAKSGDVLRIESPGGGGYGRAGEPRGETQS